MFTLSRRGVNRGRVGSHVKRQFIRIGRKIIVNPRLVHCSDQGKILLRAIGPGKKQLDHSGVCWVSSERRKTPWRNSLPHKFGCSMLYVLAFVVEGLI